MKVLVLLTVLLFAALAMAEKTVDRAYPVELPDGATVWMFNDGTRILVVPAGVDEQPLIRKACPGPCSGRYVGEMWSLSPLGN